MSYMKSNDSKKMLADRQSQSGRLVTIPAYRIPEYRDPAGDRIAPWPEPYLISSSVVEKFGLDPDTLRFYQMPDSSMHERLRPGDIALIDTADVVPRDGEKYLFQHRNGARLRRFFMQFDGSIVLSPDVYGPQYRPETVPAELADNLGVIGRVVVVISFTG